MGAALQVGVGTRLRGRFFVWQFEEACRVSQFFSIGRLKKRDRGRMKKRGGKKAEALGESFPPTSVLGGREDDQARTREQDSNRRTPR